MGSYTADVGLRHYGFNRLMQVQSPSLSFQLLILSLQTIDILETSTVYRLSHKKGPSTSFDFTKYQKDKASGFFEFIAPFFYVRLRCLQLAFRNLPPNTADMSQQSQDFECT